jgi:hypothetical protein
MQTECLFDKAASPSATLSVNRNFPSQKTKHLARKKKAPQFSILALITL